MSIFAPTRWSIVNGVKSSDERTAQQALEELCEIYRPAVLAYARQAIYRPGKRDHAEDAEDLTQAFFEDLIEKGRLLEADQKAGKFRTFLLTHFEFVHKDLLKRRRAQKRGGDVANAPIDEVAENELPVELPAPAKFDEQFQRAVIRRALSMLKTEAANKNGKLTFGELKGYLPGFPTVTPALEQKYLERSGMTNEALRIMRHRLRHRYKDLLIATLSDTVTSFDDLAAEKEALFGVLLRRLDQLIESDEEAVSSSRHKVD